MLKAVNHFKGTTMPSPYLTYALAALSFGFGVAFLRISDENSELARAKMVVEMKLETAQREAKSFRDKYASETKSREFAEAAQTLAETAERAARSQLDLETKAREAVEKNLTESEASRHSAETALADAQDQIRQLNAKLMEASAAKEQSANKTDAAAGSKGEAAAADVKAPGSADASAPVPAGAMAQASMDGGNHRSWYSFFGLF